MAWDFEHEDGWLGLMAAMADDIATQTPDEHIWLWKRKVTSLCVSHGHGDPFCTVNRGGLGNSDISIGGFSA